MFLFQDLPPAQAADPLTFGIAVKNALIAALVAFGVLYATAYRRVGSDNFVFFDWLVANRNRWINLVVTLVIFSSISLLIPDISSLSNQIGFNLNATVPLSFGLALAAWLASVTKAAEPKVADQGDPHEDDHKDGKD
jgi:hypothetical protein